MSRGVEGGYCEAGRLRPVVLGRYPVERTGWPAGLFADGDDFGAEAEGRAPPHPLGFAEPPFPMGKRTQPPSCFPHDNPLARTACSI